MKKQAVQLQQQQDYEAVSAILQKKELTQKDLETLYNRISMLNGFNMFIQNYFQGSDISEQIKLCGEMKYEKKNKGDIIFQQDDESNNKLYIILHGSCQLFLLKDLDFEDDPNFASLKELEKQQKEELNHISSSIKDKIKKIGCKFKRQISIDFEQKNLTPHEINQFRARYGKTTRLITVGSIFGERAIITSQPRTATIIADSHPTELIVLDRDKFLPALEELKRTLQLRRDILFQIFKDMDNYSSARMESMLYSFQVVNFSRGQTITEQDQKDDKFYIIAEGEAQILKKLLIDISPNKTEEKIARLSIIGPGVMVGDEIMLQSEQKYTYTVEVTSIRASVLVADKKIIDRKFPKDLKDYLKKLTFFKEKGRQHLLENKVEELKEEQISSIIRQNQRNFSIKGNKIGLKEDQTNNSTRKIKESFQSHSNLLHGENRESITLSRFGDNISSYSQSSHHNFLSQETGNLQGNRIKDQLASFDVKTHVFDFGDGKNIENAERIEKIFKFKNRAAQTNHTPANKSNLLLMKSKNIKNSKNNLIQVVKGNTQSNLANTQQTQEPSNSFDNIQIPFSLAQKKEETFSQNGKYPSVITKTSKKSSILLLPIEQFDQNKSSQVIPILTSQKIQQQITSKIVTSPLVTEKKQQYQYSTLPIKNRFFRNSDNIMQSNFEEGGSQKEQFHKTQHNVTQQNLIEKNFSNKIVSQIDHNQKQLAFSLTKKKQSQGSLSDSSLVLQQPQSSNSLTNSQKRLSLRYLQTLNAVHFQSDNNQDTFVDTKEKKQPSQLFTIQGQLFQEAKIKEIRCFTKTNKSDYEINNQEKNMLGSQRKGDHVYQIVPIRRYNNTIKEKEKETNCLQFQTQQRADISQQKEIRYSEKNNHFLNQFFHITNFLKI